MQKLPEKCNFRQSGRGRERTWLCEHLLETVGENELWNIFQKFKEHSACNVCKTQHSTINSLFVFFFLVTVCLFSPPLRRSVNSWTTTAFLCKHVFLNFWKSHKTNKIDCRQVSALSCLVSVEMQRLHIAADIRGTNWSNPWEEWSIHSGVDAFCKQSVA